MKMYETGYYFDWIGKRFEMFCFRHQREILQSLKINDGHFFYLADNKKGGAEIDMFIKAGNNNDYILYICECKYTKEKFSINDKYLKSLKNKRKFLKKYFKKSIIMMTMISKDGFIKNDNFYAIVSNEILLKDFLS